MPRSGGWTDRWHKLLLALSMASGAVTHAYHLFLYPLYTTDEGIYMQQGSASVQVRSSKSL